MSEDTKLDARESDVTESEAVIVPEDEAENTDVSTDEIDDVIEEEEEAGGPAEFIASEGGRTGRGGSNVKMNEIDYKNVSQLSRFLDRRGRILSRRKTRVSAKLQRKVAQAVKRARHLALLPYTADQTRIVRKRR